MPYKVFDERSVGIKHQKDTNAWEAYFLEHREICGKSSSEIEAVAELKKCWETYKQDCKSSNKPIYAPLSEKTYSGQFNLRLDRQLHKALACEAAQKQISLNALISNKLMQATAVDNVVYRWKMSRKPFISPDCYVLLFFSSETGQRVILQFKKSTLSDILGDDNCSSVDALFVHTNSNKILKEAIHDFISEQYYGGNVKQDDVIYCVLMSYLELRRMRCHEVPQGDGFMIIKIEQNI
jgi:predicted HicB family RNase H-like nuclease